MQKVFYYLKTAYGISDPVYGDDAVPSAGCRQWNSLGPALWALISMVILIMCNKVGHGMKFLTSITKVFISFMGFAFMDDIYLVQGANDINIWGEELIPNFQVYMRSLDGRIRAYGIAICPTKKKLFLIDFK